MFVPGRPIQPTRMFVGKARSLPMSGAPERCFTQVGLKNECAHSDRHFKLSPMFAGKARSLPKSGAP